MTPPPRGLLPVSLAGSPVGQCRRLQTALLRASFLGELRRFLSELLSPLVHPLLHLLLSGLLRPLRPD